MTPQSCPGCNECVEIGNIDWCKRPRTMKSGKRFTSLVQCSLETSEANGEGRADGDLCGPDRIHFKAGSVM